MSNEKRKEQNRKSQATYRAAAKSRIDKLLVVLKELIAELEKYKGK